MVRADKVGDQHREADAIGQGRMVAVEEQVQSSAAA